MRLQLHIHPKKNEGAVTLDKSSCIFSGITIHEMTTEMTENLHSLHFIYVLQQIHLRCICKYREWIYYGSKSVKMHFYWIILSHNTIKSQILSIWNTARFLSYSGKWNTY